MIVDERLRETLQRRAGAVEPSPGGWSEINRRIERRQRRSRTLRASLVASASFATVALAVAVVRVAGLDTPDQNVATTGTAPAAGPTTTMGFASPSAPPVEAAPDPGPGADGGGSARTTVPDPGSAARNYTPEAVWPETLPELEAGQDAVDDRREQWRNDPAAVASAYLADRGLPTPGLGPPEGGPHTTIHYTVSGFGGRVILARLLDGSVWYVTASHSNRIPALHVVRQGDRLVVDVVAAAPGSVTVRTKRPGSDWNAGATQTATVGRQQTFSVDGPADSALIVQVRHEGAEGVAVSDQYLGREIADTSHEDLHAGSVLRLGGLGMVEIDMAFGDAERAAGVPMSYDRGNAACITMAPVSGPDGVTFVSTRGTDRVDVVIVDAPGVRAASDIGVGSSVAKVRDAFPGIEERLTDGRGRLVHRSSDPGMAAFEMYFDIVDDEVAAMLSGRAGLANTDELWRDRRLTGG